MKFTGTLILALCVMAGALASPGAHGPNGEHLDGPVGNIPTGSVPRVETFSDAFELVGQLSGGELSIMIDRYETNEPVLNGTLEVQYKDMKAQAKFHADMGDYAVDDEKLLKALAVPGKHALLFTLIAGDDSDLLEATLVVPAAPADTHAHRSTRTMILIGSLAVIAIAALLLWLRRGRKGTR